MIPWRKTCLIGPEDVQPTRDDFRVIGTFNPGAIRIGNLIHLLVRVAEQPLESEVSGRTAIPRYGGDGRLHVDFIDHDLIDPVDARVVIDRRDRLARLTSVSYLRHFVAPLDGIDEPSAYEATGGVFLPGSATETFGVEDPRLTEIDGDIFFTYVSVSKHGACTSVATTSDFVTYDRRGIALPNENKDVVLLPDRIDGRYSAIHRPVSATPFGAPEMWSAWSSDLRHWGDHQPLTYASSQSHGGGSHGEDWASGRVGAGTVPVRTKGGWLSMFHGNIRSEEPGMVGRYCGALMLGEDSNPGHIIVTSSEPVLEADQAFENEGFVPGVVFPTAWIDLDDQVAIFYGAADERTAVAIAPRDSVLSALPIRADLSPH